MIFYVKVKETDEWNTIKELLTNTSSSLKALKEAVYIRTIDYKISHDAFKNYSDDVELITKLINGRIKLIVCFLQVVLVTVRQFQYLGSHLMHIWQIFITLNFMITALQLCFAMK